MRYRMLATMLLCALAACAPRSAAVRPASVTLELPEPWRAATVGDDAAQIDTLPATWSRVRTRATVRQAKNLAAEGPLLVADAALDYPQLPPGSYSCRVLRIGQAAGPDRLRSFPANFCYIKGEDDGSLTLTKQTGSDLPAGRLYMAGAKRYVFLGARQNAAGDNTLVYGSRRDRDVVGVVERVAPFRWRMVAPANDGRSLDVYELTPVPADQQPG